MAGVYNDQEKDCILLAYYLGQKDLLNCVALHRLTKDIADSFGQTSFYAGYRENSEPTIGCCLCKEKENIFKDGWEYYHLSKDVENGTLEDLSDSEIDSAWIDVLQLWCDADKVNKHPPLAVNHDQATVVRHHEAYKDIMQKHKVYLTSLVKKGKGIYELHGWSSLLLSIQRGLLDCCSFVKRFSGASSQTTTSRDTAPPEEWEEGDLTKFEATLRVEKCPKIVARYAQRCRSFGVKVKPTEKPGMISLKYMICLKCLPLDPAGVSCSLLELLSKVLVKCQEMYQLLQYRGKAQKKNSYFSAIRTSVRNGGLYPLSKKRPVRTPSLHCEANESIVKEESVGTEESFKTSAGSKNRVIENIEISRVATPLLHEEQTRKRNSTGYSVAHVCLGSSSQALTEFKDNKDEISHTVNRCAGTFRTLENDDGCSGDQEFEVERELCIISIRSAADKLTHDEDVKRAKISTETRGSPCRLKSDSQMQREHNYTATKSTRKSSRVPTVPKKYSKDYICYNNNRPLDEDQLLMLALQESQQLEKPVFSDPAHPSSKVDFVSGSDQESIGLRRLDPSVCGDTCKKMEVDAADYLSLHKYVAKQPGANVSGNSSSSSRIILNDGKPELSPVSFTGNLQKSLTKQAGDPSGIVSRKCTQSVSHQNGLINISASFGSPPESVKDAAKKSEIHQQCPDSHDVTPTSNRFVHIAVPASSIMENGLQPEICRSIKNCQPNKMDNIFNDCQIVLDTSLKISNTVTSQSTGTSLVNCLRSSAERVCPLTVSEENASSSMTNLTQEIQNKTSSTHPGEHVGRLAVARNSAKIRRSRLRNMKRLVQQRGDGSNQQEDKSEEPAIATENLSDDEPVNADKITTQLMSRQLDEPCDKSLPVAVAACMAKYTQSVDDRIRKCILSRDEEASLECKMFEPNFFLSTNAVSQNGRRYFRYKKYTCSRKSEEVQPVCQTKISIDWVPKTLTACSRAHLLYEEQYRDIVEVKNNSNTPAFPFCYQDALLMNNSNSTQGHQDQSIAEVNWWEFSANFSSPVSEHEKSKFIETSKLAPFPSLIHQLEPSNHSDPILHTMQQLEQTEISTCHSLDFTAPVVTRGQLNHIDNPAKATPSLASFESSSLQKQHPKLSAVSDHLSLVRMAFNAQIATEETKKAAATAPKVHLFSCASYPYFESPEFAVVSPHPLLYSKSLKEFPSQKVRQLCKTPSTIHGSHPISNTNNNKNSAVDRYLFLSSTRDSVAQSCNKVDVQLNSTTESSASKSRDCSVQQHSSDYSPAIESSSEKASGTSKHFLKLLSKEEVEQSLLALEYLTDQDYQAFETREVGNVSDKVIARKKVDKKMLRREAIASGDLNTNLKVTDKSPSGPKAVEKKVAKSKIAVSPVAIEGGVSKDVNLQTAPVAAIDFKLNASCHDVSTLLPELPTSPLESNDPMEKFGDGLHDNKGTEFIPNILKEYKAAQFLPSYFEIFKDITEMHKTRKDLESFDKHDFLDDEIAHGLSRHLSPRIDKLSIIPSSGFKPDLLLAHGNKYGMAQLQHYFKPRKNRWHGRKESKHHVKNGKKSMYDRLTEILASDFKMSWDCDRRKSSCNKFWKKHSNCRPGIRERKFSKKKKILWWKEFEVGNKDTHSHEHISSLTGVASQIDETVQTSSQRVNTDRQESPVQVANACPGERERSISPVLCGRSVTHQRKLKLASPQPSCAGPACLTVPISDQSRKPHSSKVTEVPKQRTASSADNMLDNADRNSTGNVVGRVISDNSAEGDESCWPNTTNLEDATFGMHKPLVRKRQFGGEDKLEQASECKKPKCDQFFTSKPMVALIDNNERSVLSWQHRNAHSSEKLPDKSSNHQGPALFSFATQSVTPLMMIPANNATRNVFEALTQPNKSSSSAPIDRSLGAEEDVLEQKNRPSRAGGANGKKKRKVKTNPFNPTMNEAFVSPEKCALRSTRRSSHGGKLGAVWQ